jgi:hypothetical protein
MTAHMDRLEELTVPGVGPPVLSQHGAASRARSPPTVVEGRGAGALGAIGWARRPSPGHPAAPLVAERAVELAVVSGAAVTALPEADAEPLRASNGIAAELRY